MTDEQAFGGEPVDIISAYNSITMQVTIDQMAESYEWRGIFSQPLFTAMGTAFDTEVLTGEPSNNAVSIPDAPMTVARQPLREYLLETFSEAEVNAYYERRAEWERKWEARKAYEKTFRFKVKSAYREGIERLSGAVGVLKHGVETHDDCY